MFLTKEWIEEAFPDDHVLATHRKDDMLSDTRIKSVIQAAVGSALHYLRF